MTSKPPCNIAASVRQRLTNLSRERSEDLQFVLTRYGLERLLYRLSISPYASQFILKGAALFHLWTGQPHRSTRDLDLLGSWRTREKLSWLKNFRRRWHWELPTVA